MSTTAEALEALEKVDQLRADLATAANVTRQLTEERDAALRQVDEASAEYIRMLGTERARREEIRESMGAAIARVETISAALATEREGLQLLLLDEETAHQVTMQERDRLRGSLESLVKHVGDMHHVAEPLIGIVRYNYRGTNISLLADQTLPVFDRSGALLSSARAALAGVEPLSLVEKPVAASTPQPGDET